MMVDITKGLEKTLYEVNMLEYTKKVKVVYTRAEEELIEFMNICKLKDSEVMFFPYNNAVLDKDVVKEVEKISPDTHQPKRFGNKDK